MSYSGNRRRSRNEEVLLDELAQALQAAGAFISAAQHILKRDPLFPSGSQSVDDAADQLTRACRALHQLRAT